jgi:hypothetical protein
LIFYDNTLIYVSKTFPEFYISIGHVDCGKCRENGGMKMDYFDWTCGRWKVLRNPCNENEIIAESYYSIFPL